MLRLIQPKDNTAIEQVIKAVLTEHGLNKPGFAYVDPELLDMYAAYRQKDRAYWVIELDGRVVGGGGIAPLRGAESAVCELQKMYFLPEGRGQGYGKAIIELAEEFARHAGYDCIYLETVPAMVPARGLYHRMGFEVIPERMGDTGHSGCGYFMAKKL